MDMDSRPAIRIDSAATALAVCFLIASGCATTRPLAEGPRPEFGIASYYGHSHHGLRTASGERFDMHEMTAAHRTLPFGTRVRVTNLENGRAVVVTINDRGPWKKDRIVDVSYEAARELHMIGTGTARVRVDVL
jgi:rare lipoprotein A